MAGTWPQSSRANSAGTFACLRKGSNLKTIDIDTEESASVDRNLDHQSDTYNSDEKPAGELPCSSPAVNCVELIVDSDNESVDQGGLVPNPVGDANRAYHGKQGLAETYGLHVKNGGALALGNTDGSPLAWAVLRPSPSGSVSKPVVGKANKRKIMSHESGPPTRTHQRASQHLHPSGGKKVGSKRAIDGAAVVRSVKGASDEGAAKMCERAGALLCTALCGGEHAQAIATAIVEAFLQENEPDCARRLLLDLVAALRRNKALREEILVSGATKARELAQQDPRQWATDELQAKRSRWAEESLNEIKPNGPIGVCPSCGGRAVVAAGTAGSGRAGRTTKAFYHYSCMETHCGKASHVKQD
eukprot:gnl/TRDRNA2_/TRDRNA2_135247_c0_seq1.p1 gnl/TRDRNA2_/TRDRNA2_135247_c0~~gnl/TRDRNA2_/TRDRNA2_135247_c0_seq1.p1  ORF type:complete len:360 (+),score=48.48 gnl/TRDRNA2_/TRDRNA2_135247_c0_seq1:50-1129(+)